MTSTRLRIALGFGTAASALLLTVGCSSDDAPAPVTTTQAVPPATVGEDTETTSPPSNPAAASVKIPNVQGKTVKKATEALEDVGLVPAVEDLHGMGDNVPPDWKVVGTVPDFDVEVPEGTTVYVYATE